MQYKKSKKLPNFLEESEIQTMLWKVEKDNLRNYLILLVLSHTGMRVNELLSLKKEDFDFDYNTINIMEKREIPLIEELRKPLRLYIDTLKPKEKLIKLSERQVRNIIGKYGPRKSFKLNPYTIRHSFAVYCVKQGMNLLSLQEILGHSHLEETLKYLYAYERDVKHELNLVFSHGYY